MRKKCAESLALLVSVSRPGLLALFLTFALAVALPAVDAGNTSTASEESSIRNKDEQANEIPAINEEAEMDKNDDKESFSTRMFEETPDSVEQPVYPGVTNNVLEKSATGEPAIKLYYPSFGISAVDAAIKNWLNDRLAYYNSLVKDSIEPEEDEIQRGNWEMTGFYTLDRPKPSIASMLFNIYAYTGGAHGNLWLYSLAYNLENGKQILFENLFGNPQRALELLSAISIEKLRLAIGEDTDEEWLERGAGPEMDNFSVLTLVPDGLFAEFQPYQVGPWAIGPQRVFISIRELKDAQPSEAIWNLPDMDQDSTMADKKTDGENETNEESAGK